MLRPEQMRRLLIAAPKGEIDAIIEELYRHNVYHIEDFVPEIESPEGLSIGHPLREQAMRPRRSSRSGPLRMRAG